MGALKETAHFIFRMDNLMVDYTARPEDIKVMEEALSGIDAYQTRDIPEKEVFQWTPDGKKARLCYAGDGPVCCYAPEILLRAALNSRSP